MKGWKSKGIQMTQQSIFYLNLTNGLEFIDKFNSTKFVRIQSSALENSCFDKVIYELDYQFLIDLALGHHITLVDASSKHEKSRSIWQGIPWIEYVLNRRWFDLKPESVVLKNKHNCVNYFEQQYRALKSVTKRKIDYVKYFLNQNLTNVHIDSLCFKSKDVDTVYYKKYLYPKGEHQVGHSNISIDNYSVGIDNTKKGCKDISPLSECNLS